eukprot:CAMPEP_0168397532 /NCGR_PEP_ID=MMETSP0228-20121227/21114_1 /TAXON_ID=133427 /ORGANISM="Protoceratium reticulatum, Strain CCCM 535 (=CCMP 1889)" /LENGTH=297 /DNA_ID=CAMNT_0008411011 /DNA_START=92 /DNA_END=982 /DNA_ORIENTATION=+
MAQPPPGARSYGNASKDFDLAAQKTPFMSNRRRVSIVVMLICLLVPIAMYAAVSAVISFTVHHSSPAFTWLVVFLGVLVVFLVSALAGTAIWMRYWLLDTTREPYWYVFLAVTTLLAFVFAVFLGLTNWWNNTLPFLELQNLSVHPAVDPAMMTGRQLMDVGRVTFTPGSKLDLTHSIGFKNVDRYCVAPVVPPSGVPDSYDFWAIGLNCCSGNANDFHCGEYDSQAARSGLRLMRADQRSYYRLAVQQAEATYGLRASHPLFFYWMQDPDAELQSYRDDAGKYYLLGLAAVFFCQV